MFSFCVSGAEYVNVLLGSACIIIWLTVRTVEIIHLNVNEPTYRLWHDLMHNGKVNEHQHSRNVIKNRIMTNLAPFVSYMILPPNSLVDSSNSLASSRPLSSSSFLGSTNPSVPIIGPPLHINDISDCAVL